MKKLGKILLVLGLTLLFAVPVFAQRMVHRLKLHRLRLQLLGMY